MIKLGIIGFSKNNGHPYSFSAIVNGFNEVHFKKVGYPQILSYLKKKKKKEFFIKNLKITHAWSEDFKKTKMTQTRFTHPGIVKKKQQQSTDPDRDNED